MLLRESGPKYFATHTHAHPYTQSKDQATLHPLCHRHHQHRRHEQDVGSRPGDAVQTTRDPEEEREQ